MANKKKPTAMQLKEQIEMLTRHVNFLSRMIDSVGVGFSSYVKFKNEESEFKDYLENNKNLHKLTEEENEDRKKGHLDQNNAVSDKKVRKKDDGKK